MRSLVLLALLSSCYSPNLRECTVACAAPEDCATDQVCGPEGLCAGAGVRCGMPAGDAPARDARTPIDARDLCALGCTQGTCEDGVCVIDCSATGSCTTDVLCPMNLPCRVVCGAGSCTHHILCDKATSCEVTCSGTNSCLDEIRCGAGPCDVTCSGDGSCHKRIKCMSSCACDIACTGEDTCPDPPECPAGDACRLGAGCSSQLAGCDRCT